MNLTVFYSESKCYYLAAKTQTRLILALILELELLTPRRKYAKYFKCDFDVKSRLYEYKLKMNDHWNTIVTFGVCAPNKNTGNSYRI